MKHRDSLSCWLLVFSLCWTNLTNGWQWISYASISDFAAQYYKVSLNEVNWLSLLYSVIMILTALSSIWFIDYYGIKVTLALSSILNLICGVIRVFSSSASMGSSNRYITLIAGSILGGLAQPLCLFSSTKLAATWFSPENRVSANTVATMGNPLGVFLSNLLSPVIVKGHIDIPYLNLVNLAQPLIGILLMFLSVSLAPKPQNMYTIYKSLPLLDQIKICFKNLQFLLLMTSFGIFLGIFNTISTLIQQILCPFGYSDLFSGFCGALFLAMGIPGVLIVGPIVTRTHALKEVVKWGTLITSFGIISFSIVSSLPDQKVLIALSVAWMGMIGFGVFPSALELAAETAYPAGEVISTGVLITMTQLVSLMLTMVSQKIAIPAKNLENISKCALKDVRVYWISNVVLAVIFVVNSTVFFFGFKTDYKRVISEMGGSDRHETYASLVEDE